MYSAKAPNEVLASAVNGTGSRDTKQATAAPRISAAAKRVRE
jgi:hypothetical protein